MIQNTSGGILPAGFIEINEKRLLYGGIIFTALLYAVLIILSDDCAGMQDSYQHYLLARYAFLHPENFLDQWGKPVFTLLAAPVSQFGLKALMAFNCTLAICSGVLAYLVSKKFGFRHAVLAFYFTCFTPVLFKNALSGLTEILAAFMLILFLYLFLSQRKITASIMISFLPMVRSEGFVILVVIMVSYFLSKNYRYLVWLITGSVLFNIAGFLYSGEYLWLFSKNPYVNAGNIYGYGNFMHFFDSNARIFGVPLSILFALGNIYILHKIYVSIRSGKAPDHFRAEIFLVYGICYAYIFAHSYLWWKGMWGSMGLIRVIAVIVPLLAIICLQGLNYFLRLFETIPRVKTALIILLSLLVIYTPFEIDTFPLRQGGEEKLFSEVAVWIKQSPYVHEKQYGLNPSYSIRLDEDPFDRNRFAMLYDYDPLHSPEGSLVIWDAHFGPNEAHMPLAQMLHDPRLELIKKFSPEQPFTTVNDHPFEICVFRIKK